MKRKADKIVIGALECCNLPQLGLLNVQMRVDSGAATSSLHVDNLEEFLHEGKRWVRFEIRPDVHTVDRVVTASARLSGKKVVKSSSADVETRAVIRTTICLAGKQWKIKLTLTDRSSMSNVMLLGREAMKGRVLIDPGQEFLLSTPNPAQS